MDDGGMPRPEEPFNARSHIVKIDILVLVEIQGYFLQRGVL
jgi:hypothetical protein